MMSFAMPRLSQIVSADAIAKCHNLCGDAFLHSVHNGWMNETNKNGGPNHLREWRIYRKLTLGELAERVGTNANMIGYLESGERGLTAKWLRKLADALDTTPGMILDHDPADIDSDILEIWASASIRQKRQIAEIAAALIRAEA